MSAATLGQEGLAALDRRDYSKAITALTAALASSASPKWLIARSKALISTSRFDEALADAESAYHLALDRGHRDLILDAQYRRAVALHRLGKHADADACLAWVMAASRGGKLSDAEKSVAGMDAGGRYPVKKADVEALLEKEGGEALGKEKREKQGVDPAARIFGAVKEAPPGGKVFRMAGTLRLSVLHAMQASPEDAEGQKLTVCVVPPKRDDGPPKLATEAKPVASSAPKKLRIDAYESDEYQTISVFTKNVDKEQFKLQWLSDSKVAIGPLPEAPQGSAVIELGGAADKEKVSATVRPMKVELRIGKRTAAKYNSPKCYFSDGTPAGDQPSEPAPAAAPPATIPAPAAKPEPKLPTYPTSSRSGPKNWDSIAADDEEEEGSGDPNHFFKTLYAGASDEQKRAMMKSFTESNGTALSTDWGDVSQRKVETKPPEGVEAKKWD